MNPFLKLSALATALLVTAGCGAGAGAPAPIPAPAASQGVLTVSGKSEIQATPDIVIIQVGVNSRQPTSEQARAHNAEMIGVTIAAIESLGIPRQDIQTGGLSLWPYHNEYGTVRLGYEMSTDMSVTVRDMDLAGKVVDAAIDAGSNTLSGINFQVSNREELYQQALTQAVAAARAKAQALAAADGRSVGQALDILEAGAAVRENPYTGGGSMKVAASYDTAVMAGTTTITAEVSVTFVLD